MILDIEAEEATPLDCMVERDRAIRMEPSSLMFMLPNNTNDDNDDDDDDDDCQRRRRLLRLILLLCEDNQVRTTVNY